MNTEIAVANPLVGILFIGAAVYFIGHATTFWLRRAGFFKAIFWPAVLIVGHPTACVRKVVGEKCPLPGP